MTQYKKNDIIKTSGGCHYVVEQSSSSWSVKVNTRGLKELGYRVAKSPMTIIDTYNAPKIVGRLDQIQKEKEMSKLYEFEIDGEKLFGSKLAVNSEGKWVMEAKGGKGVFALSKEDLQEVIPYSILVQPHFTKEKKHMMAEKDKYKVGEVFVMENSSGFAFYRVVKVDTKTNTSETFKPTEKIEVSSV